MNDVFVTVTGLVVTDPQAKVYDQSVPLTSFRMLSTSRRFDRETRGWVDADKMWLGVTCWRTLAVNVERSVLKRDRVIVHGKLRIREWSDEEGRPRSRAEIIADSIGHDLAFGTSLFTRTRRVETPGQDPRDAAADALAHAVELEAMDVDLDALLAERGPEPEPERHPDLDLDIDDADVRG